MESEEIQKRLSENLRKIRKARKLTQFDLAVQSNLSEAMIKNIELHRSWVSEKTLSQITKALRIDVFQLFLPSAADFAEKKRVKSAVTKEITKNLRKYVEEQIQLIELD